MPVTLPAFATRDELYRRLEVDDRPGDDDTDEHDRADGLLEDASALIRGVAGRSWVRLGDDDEPVLIAPAVVVATTIAAARRAWVNPDADQTEQDPAGSVTHAMNPDGRAPVFLTKQEREDVLRAAGRQPMGTVQVRAGTLPSDALVPCRHPADVDQEVEHRHADRLRWA